MLKLGYKLMSEEHGPTDLVRNAQRAEQAGFDFAAISDHFFPWLEEQGHAPFAWSVLGALANATRRLGLMTAVTCPIMRYHPAIIAQAQLRWVCSATTVSPLGLVQENGSTSTSSAWAGQAGASVRSVCRKRSTSFKVCWQAVCQTTGEAILWSTMRAYSIGLSASQP